MRRKLIAGNWKMNGLRAGGVALASGLAEKCKAETLNCDFLVCPPVHLLISVAEAVAGSGIGIGGQDCHTAVSGAHTGDVSAEMLADVGCGFVILGHSERRAEPRRKHRCPGSRQDRSWPRRSAWIDANRLRRRDRRASAWTAVPWR